MARYALVVGIAEYGNSSLNLTKSTIDAEAVAQLLEQHGNFQEVKRLPRRWNRDRNCYEVAHKRLTGIDFGKVLREFLLEQALKSEALIYFSGHGITVSDILGRQKGYLATSDCTLETIEKHGIALDSLNALIREADLSSLIVLLDCCHSGYFLERNLVEQTLTAFSSRKDYYLITACRSFEKAYESQQYSAFTEALLKGLSQENAGSDGRVSGDRVFAVIDEKLKGSGQEPIRMGWGRSLTLVQYQPKKTEIVVDETCPYQGLEAFGKEQARFFFGREKVVQLLMEKLGQANFVPIIGASGSGKSSVVRAGLIPQLEKNGWRVLELILPGVEPLAELKRTLTKLFGRTEVREVYSLIDTDGLRPVIERLSGSERLLLVVDQFEEVFTVCSKEEERRHFIDLLTQVAEIPDSRLAIVTTMRADFLEPCLSYESLTQLIQDEAVYMPPLVGAELEEAIATPAKLQGYSFEKGLLGEILQDVGKEKGCLPLLQFALTELWEQRDRQTYQLKVAEYKQLGGVIGALNRHAEQIYESFQEQQQYWVKRILLKLLRTSVEAKDTRQRQTKTKLLAITDDNSLNDPCISDILDQLVQGRLLTTNQELEGEASVDLAHEALMDGWKRFVKWREESQKQRRLIDRIEDAHQEWLKNPQDENLMMGGLLNQSREYWPALEPNLQSPVKEFYKQSDAYQKKISAENEELKRQVYYQKTQELLGESQKLVDISDEQRLNNAMYRYMTQELAEELLKLDDAKLGGERKDVSILFSDIRGYTTLTENLEPEEVVGMLNEYFESMVETIFKYKGTLDKYIGDAIMAVFGSPLPLKDHAWRAVQTAVEMRQRLQEFNERRLSLHKAPIKIGIGLNSDSVISGNIGSSKRMEFTAIGDGVNLGSRLEGASKQYGCDIVISENTYKPCADKVIVRELDRIRVKGRNHPVEIYELIALQGEQISSQKQEIIEHYHKGREYYLNRQFARALGEFGIVMEIDSEDKSAKLHLERCQHWLATPPPENWDGVYTT